MSAEAATFLFADIAGFTALTEAHGDEEAVSLVADFAAAVRSELPSCDGVLVKTMETPSCCGSPSPGRPSSTPFASPTS